MDEATPHIHERHVFDATNRYGEIEPKQETALEELGLSLIHIYLADLNEQCVERRDFLMNQIMEQEGITEELKSRDQME